MGESSISEPVYVILLLVAILALSCTLSTSIALFQKIRSNASKSAVSARLLFYLHLSLLFEEIADIPYLYTLSPSLCSFIGWVGFYGGLSNILAMSLLVMHYLNLINFCSKPLHNFIRNWKEHLIFGFPLITLLPFITDSYGQIQDAFCGLPSATETDNLWGIFILHFWLWIVLIISIGCFIHTLHAAYKLDGILANKILSSIGGYILVTMAVWLERTIPRIIEISSKAVRIPPQTYVAMVYCVYIQGIIYTLFYYLDKDVFNEQIPFEDDDVNSPSFHITDFNLSTITNSLHMSMSFYQTDRPLSVPLYQVDRQTMTQPSASIASSRRQSLEK